MQNRGKDYASVRTVDDITEDFDATPPSNERISEEDTHHDFQQVYHPIFSEMMELKNHGDNVLWRETARWLKFEEKVEKGGRWSKPFVTTVFLHNLYDLRSLIQGGLVILDMDATDLQQIAKFLSSSMVESNLLAPDKIAQLNNTLSAKIIHQHQKRNISCSRPTSKKSDLLTSPNFVEDVDKNNSNFMKKISFDSEVCNIMVGEVDYLDKPLTAFIRLKSSVLMDNLTEVQVPTRFLFLLLGPFSCSVEFCEIGRALAACMSDEIFQDVAYRAVNCDQLLAGLDEILKGATVLPPGKWNPSTRVQPCLDSTSRNTRRSSIDKEKEQLQKDEEERKLRQETGLVRTGILFGGLFNDIKRRAPWYWSDFKDAFHLQCIASWIFLYFACLSPIITFGALLSQVTGTNMAAMESLVAGFVCGLLYGFSSGQPLTILASTGPVLVFETIVYDYCDTIGWDYMSFRLCIGTWIAVILMILVAVDASAFVCYITRFTEDNFATLVAVIFIYEAIENVFLIEKKFPIGSVLYGNNSYQSLLLINASMEMQLSGEVTTLPTNITDLNELQTLSEGCFSNNTPNVFLMSILLFIGTYLISTQLKKFKSSLFFPSKIRMLISDFAVTIAIVSMSMLDFYVGISTPKLVVPKTFEPTLPGRAWIITPFKNNSWISVFIAIPPALLGTILIFMDQQITAVIVNRKQHKLKKGCGYHLDLFVLSILIQICSCMGLPWFVAATVPSINHVNSLKLESELAAPGEKQRFVGVREQRVTHILIFLTIGLSVFLTPILGFIPMPVLYGIFLFMGAESLRGLELFNRILIMLMPSKYQPDYLFLREVQIGRVHLFTIIQLACLVCLWTVKSFSSTSILFPLMLVVMIAVRKFLDHVFTQEELRILDDIMPQNSSKDQKTHRDENDWNSISKISYYILGPKLITTEKQTVELC